MKGLASVLGRFSEGLRTRKILPSLLEEVREMLGLSIVTRGKGKQVLIACHPDERYKFVTIHPPQCVRDIQCSHIIPIREFGSTKSEAPFCGQRASTKHVNTPGQSAFVTK